MAIKRKILFVKIDTKSAEYDYGSNMLQKAEQLKGMILRKEKLIHNDSVLWR